MFRELIGYCVTAITSSGFYSLAVQHSTTMTYVNIGFWSGNVLHHVCLGSAPRGMLLPRKILVLISSFISLFETPPACVSLINFDEKMSHCLSNCLPGDHRPSVVRTYGPEEFEKSLGLPTSQIIERHDYRTILDFLLMKLRTALDKDWLKKLPLLHKVTYIFAQVVKRDTRTSFHSLSLFSVGSGQIRILPTRCIFNHREPLQSLGQCARTP